MCDVGSDTCKWFFSRMESEYDQMGQLPLYRRSRADSEGNKIYSEITQVMLSGNSIKA